MSDHYEDPNTSLKALTNFVAGAVGGAGSTSLIHPLDSIKVKLQTFPHLYKGGMHCIREVLSKEGVTGLYRGLAPGVTLSMTEASIRYMIYGVCQDLVRSTVTKGSSEKMTLTHNAMAGGLTGLLATFASCPIEVVKCRMQGRLEMSTISKHLSQRGAFGFALHAIRTEGIRGLYRGFSSNVARNAPGEMVFFATYEQTRSLLKRPGQVKDDLGVLGCFACGSCAGIMYWVSIYPLDVVKSRVQVLSAQGQIQGLVTTFLMILRSEGTWSMTEWINEVVVFAGVRPLYHGVLYSIPRAILGSGSHFVFYEATRKIILYRNQQLS